MKRFNRTWLREHPGAILHIRNNASAYGWMIRKAIGSWGNHNALIIRWYDDRDYIGEAIAPIAKLTHLTEYEARINDGESEVKVYLPVGYTKELGLWVSTYWCRHIKNSPYDYWGIIQLPRKLTAQWIARKMGWQWAEKQAGTEWGRWCTQAVQEAYLNNPQDPMDLYKKLNATPRTHENRVSEGVFYEYTSAAIVDV